MRCSTNTQSWGDVMTSLDEIRKNLDVIDNEIVSLYEKRMQLCKEVAAYKIETGKKVFDKEREMQKLAAVSAKTSNEFNRKGIKELFEQLMSMSRKLQYQEITKKGTSGRLPFIKVNELDTREARIVFPGTEGSYTQAAMKKYFGDAIESFHVKAFREAVEAMEEGTADFAVLPIENSSAGGVNEVYDLLVEYENYIVGETILPINHTLAGVKGTTKETIQAVYSHPQGLMQCTRFLDQHRNWQQISMANTAIAAEKVLMENDISKAAICSEYAAQVHNLEVLETHVNDNGNNSTRFIVITNQKIFLPDADKISICFEVPHESGSLYHILSHFIYNDLNMTKIESRPIEGRTWEYRFFVDFEGNLADSAVKNALRGLREETRTLKILGNYSDGSGITTGEECF